mmetsp:Transcript_111114/g.313494  ORF Transcript_111114/g.313494 Transcript_111114/m.313494 type:complete len:664 (-) Transcript_111114:94-2085(-)
MLFMTFYLSTIAEIMYSKGDVAFSQNANDARDYIFSKAAGMFNGVGFVWFPVVQLCIWRCQWSTCFYIQSATFVAVAALLAVPVLELQVVAFALQSMGRLMIFGFHHAYIEDKFGLEHFGILNGIASLIAGSLGLLSYPLQLLAIYTFHGNYLYVLLGLMAALLAAAKFPHLLRRLPVCNWAETLYVDPLVFRRPGTLHEVVSIVQNAKKIRCAGSMHSCAPLIECNDVILSLERFDKILSIDVSNKRVRVQGGVKIHHLCEALEEHGLAIGTLGTIDWQAVVGAVMTGTHGGSLTIPSLHTFMEAYKMIIADGSITEVRREEDPYRFSALAPSMGVMGVIIEAEMTVVPLQYLEAQLWAIAIEELPSTFQEVMKSNKYARVVAYPSVGKATIWVANPVERGAAVARGAMRTEGYVNFRDEYEKAWLEEYLRLSSLGNYDVADKLLQCVLDSQLKRLAHYEGQYNHVLCKERNHGIPHADMEFAFDFEQAPAVLSTVLNHFQKRRMPYYNYEVRCTRRDDAMLSACHGRDTMWIDFQAKVPANWAFFGEMEDLLLPFEYRKHWAKGMDHMNPQYIMKQYPMLQDFLGIIVQYDPHGKFQNDHVQMWLRTMVREVADTTGMASDAGGTKGLGDEAVVQLFKAKSSSSVTASLSRVKSQQSVLQI